MTFLKRIVPDFDRRTAVVLLGGTLVMTLMLYQGQASFFLRHLAPLPSPGGARDPDLWRLYSLLWEFLAMLVLWVAAPLAAARVWLGDRPRDHGFALGDVGAGVKLTVLAILVATPFLYVSSFDPAFQAEYPLTRLAGVSVGHFALWQACRLVYYLAWEYFFRGFLLFGLRAKVGDFVAIAIQTVPSTIIHFGKPEGEMVAAIVAGVAFGVIALRTRSILYVFLIHWAIGALNDAFCLLNAA